MGKVVVEDVGPGDAGKEGRTGGLEGLGASGFKDRDEVIDKGVVSDGNQGVGGGSEGEERPEKGKFGGIRDV